MEFLEACRRLIGIDSSPSAGNLEAARFVESLARDFGLDAELEQESWNGVDQANILVRPAGTSSTGLSGEFLLETHLDTPDPGAYALWQKTGANPFNASIYTSGDGAVENSEAAGGSNEMIYGLGTADVKLDFLCKLYALRDVVRRKDAGAKWKVVPVIAGTYGEELGMPGAVKLIRKKKVKPVAVLVGEPTNMQLVVAGKGFASVEIEVPFSDDEKNFRSEHDLSESALTQSRLFAGRAAHSSAPQHGDSAIEKMLDALERLPSGIAIMEIEGGVNFNTVASQAVLEIDSVSGFAGDGLNQLMAQKLIRIRASVKRVQDQFRKFPDPQFLPQEPTLNIGMIRTYEDHVKLSGCVRLPPSVSQSDYEGWMQILREACAAEGAVFRIGDYKAPFRSTTSSPIAKAAESVLESMHLNASRTTQAVANEANVFAKFGLDCAVWGPGQGVGNSHTPNECVRISELNQATEFYRRVIEQMCL